MKIGKNPIIVIGMHRSGTSLVSRCLSDLGVCMGRELSPNAESRIFQKINHDLLALCNTRWDDLDGLEKCWDTSHSTSKGIELASRLLFSEKMIDRFLPKQSWRQKLFTRGLTLWGWKDPRNTWTLPVYLPIFPEAKVVHVVRNGVDSAISLCRRERSREQSVSELCQLFSYCFRLWEGYVARSLELISQLPSHRSLTISYEDLLADSENTLAELIRFARCHPTTAQYNDTIEAINPGRLDNSKMRSKYKLEINELPESALMSRLGYRYL